MIVEGEFPVAAPAEALIGYLFDARLMASCLPGCESLEPLPEDRYRAVVVVAVAGIKARFNLQVEVTERLEREVRAITRGEEGSQASALQAESRVILEPIDGGTLVRYRSDVSLTGRLGRFGLGMMKKKAQSMGDEFAVNLRRELEPPAAVAVPAQAPAETAPSALQRWWAALLRWLRGLRPADGAG